MGVSRPIGVTILAILSALAAIGIVSQLVTLLIGSSLFSQQSSGIGNFVSAFLIIFVPLLIVLILLTLLVAYGLWKGKKWGWLIFVIFTVLGIISSAIAIADGIYYGVLGIVIEAIILYYMTKNNVKVYFGIGNPTIIQPKSPDKRLILGLIMIIIIAVGYVLYSYGTHRQPNAGLTNGNSPLLSSSCIADPGYYCNILSYNHANGEIKIDINQLTGENWTNIYIVFVPQGTTYSSYGIPNVSFEPPQAAHISLMSGDKTQTIMLEVGNYANTGSIISGSIWAKYNITSGNSSQTYYVQMASVSYQSS